MRPGRLIVMCLAIGVAVLQGCNRSKTPKTVPVHGHVRLDGKPIEGADIGFYCQGAAGHAAIGRTDALGKYSLSTFGVNDGAIPGRHAVVISKYVYDTGAGDSRSSGDKGLKSPTPTGPIVYASTKAKPVIPERYSVASKSGLTADVNADGGEIDFDLKSR
jgi:hypothetical protein